MMRIDLGGMLRQADEYIRRHVKSKAVREAEKRRSERQSREAGRRLKRAAWLGGTSGLAIVGAGLVAPIAGPALIAAAGAALLVTAGSLARPSRPRGADGDFSQAELAALPGDAEDWLLERRDALPLDCRPMLDRIFLRLGDLEPHLGSLQPHSTAAWEARRLLGDHLPQLILAYEALLPSVREADAEVRERLRSGLATLGDALDDLCREVCRQPLMSFETRGRFIESRYREPDPQLGQNRPSRRVE
jgi:hypothetical protein